METISLAIGIPSLVAAAAAAFFGYRAARSSSKQAEVARRAYLDSIPSQLNVIARIVAVDESPVGGVCLQLDIRNGGLGRAFNVGYEARSTFLGNFDYQRTVRTAQTFNLMRRDPRAARSRVSYPPFGFDERLDMPRCLRGVGLKYLDPDQYHTIEDLFFVPWQYLGHPSKHKLKPLEQVLLPGITDEELKEVEESVLPGTLEEKLKAIFEKYKPRKPDTEEYEELDFSGTQYKRDGTLPPGILLYGSQDSDYGGRYKTFLFGPGNGLQLTLRFSHFGGEETKCFALPSPLLIFQPELGKEIHLMETDADGVDLNYSGTITVY